MSLSTTKNNLLQTLDKLNGLVENELSKKEIVELKNKLTNNQMSLVVIGQFKRGKSTLINALLQKEILPTAVVPLTSIITEISYNQKPQYTVFFLDNSIKNINFEELNQYVTETNNPNNVKKVEKVKIGYPLSYLQNGLTIIDTPGIGSIYEHNTEITYNFLPRADVAVFVTSVDPALTKSEIDFLQHSKNFISKFFIVQNKIDLLNKTEQTEVLDFAKATLKKTLCLETIKIYPLSAKQFLSGIKEQNNEKINNSQFLHFKKDLENFLSFEADQTLFESIKNKILRLLQHHLTLFQLEQKALNLSLEELNNKIFQLNKYFDKQKIEKNHIVFALQGEKQILIKNLEEKLNTLKENKTKDLLSKLENVYKQNTSLKTKDLSKVLDNFIRNELQNNFNNELIEQEKNLEKSLTELTQKLTAKLNELNNQTIEAVGKIFDLTLQSLDYQVTLEKSSFDFRFDNEEGLTEFLIKNLINYLPKLLSHRLLYQKAKKELQIQLDRHIGRLRVDLTNRINKTVLDFEKQFNQLTTLLLADIESSLHKSLELQKSNTEVSSTKQKILQEKINNLLKIKNNL